MLTTETAMRTVLHERVISHQSCTCDGDVLNAVAGSGDDDVLHAGIGDEDGEDVAALMTYNILFMVHSDTRGRRIYQILTE